MSDCYCIRNKVASDYMLKTECNKKLHTIKGEKKIRMVSSIGCFFFHKKADYKKKQLC